MRENSHVAEQAYRKSAFQSITEGRGAVKKIKKGGRQLSALSSMEEEAM